jgi:hypothetical protein
MGKESMADESLDVHPALAIKLPGSGLDALE